MMRGEILGDAESILTQHGMRSEIYLISRIKQSHRLVEDLENTVRWVQQKLEIDPSKTDTPLFLDSAREIGSWKSFTAC